MSDIGIHIPAWLVVIAVSVEFWPFVLALTATAIATAFFTSGYWRLAAIVMAVLLAFDVAASGLMALSGRNDAQAVDSDLPAPQRVDGLTLPTGTAVTWTDPTHTHVLAAALPAPATVLGVQIERLQRTVDDGWIVRLAGPQSIEGWTCRPDFVDLDPEGRLRTCTLAAERGWNGWTIPPDSLLRLDRPDHTVGLVFPESYAAIAPEIGRPLPATGLMSINPDGSLDTVYFDADTPLAVCGTSLWNTLKWDYAPASLGQGRNRPPVSVTGASQAGDTVTLKLPDCAK